MSALLELYPMFNLVNSSAARNWGVKQELLQATPLRQLPQPTPSHSPDAPTDMVTPLAEDQPAGYGVPDAEAGYLEYEESVPFSLAEPRVPAAAFVTPKISTTSQSRAGEEAAKGDLIRRELGAFSRGLQARVFEPRLFLHIKHAKLRPHGSKEKLKPYVSIHLLGKDGEKISLPELQVRAAIVGGEERKA